LVPILATLLIGVATKVGVGLAATAAKKLFTKSPAETAAAKRATFAEELQRAKPTANGPTPLAATDAPIAPASASALGLRQRAGRAASTRVAGVGAASASGASDSTEAPPSSRRRVSADQLPLATRVPTRRRAHAVFRLRQQHVSAYRRMDVTGR
jgi:hypothetical protein